MTGKNFQTEMTWSANAYCGRDLGLGLRGKIAIHHGAAGPAVRLARFCSMQAVIFETLGISELAQAHRVRQCTSPAPRRR